MAPRSENSKKTAGRAKKAANDAKKQATVEADKERKEAESWEDKGLKGGKATKEAKEEKRKADLARKAETARLLAKEEEAMPSKVSTAPKAGQKKKQTESARPAGPGAIAAGGELVGGGTKGKTPETEIESFSATGIDDALDLLSVVTAKMDKASLGQQAAVLERHPERRFMAAYKTYEERELPQIKQDHPGLRLQQYKDLLHKQFQKSPDNPYNQATVSYDAKKEEAVAALRRRNAEVEERLRSD